MSALLLTSCGIANQESAMHDANQNSVVTATGVSMPANGEANTNTGAPLLDVYDGWKEITDRTNGISFKVPFGWSARINQEAAADSYDPGHRFVGIFNADSKQDYTQRIDIYQKPMATVRSESQFLNGTYGTAGEDEEVEINGVTWTRFEYTIPTAGETLVIYLTEVNGVTYETGYSADAEGTLFGKPLVESIVLDAA